MERTLGTTAAPISIPPSKKASARVALVNLNPATHRVLTECFRQFGMESIAMTGEATERLQKEKFEACVVKVSPESEPVMMSARSSPSNSRVIFYGLGGTAQDSLGFSKYGLNAIFHEPLERTAALKLVRATQPLVTHEFRRYIRIPIVTEVNVVLADGRRFSATSAEISSGGHVLQDHRRVAAQSDAGSFFCAIDPAADLGEGRCDLAQTAKPLIWNAF